MREQVIDISWSCEIDLRDYPPGDYLDLAAIADAIADGSMANFVAEAGELASGTTGILVDGEIVIG